MIRNRLNRSAGKKIVLAVVIIATVWLLSVFLFVVNTGTTDQSAETSRVTADDRLPFECPTINLVYTWVNGSDPEHVNARNLRSGDTRYGSPGNSRFRDLGGLFYSLRSVDKFAPWINKIFIVTSGQVPSYLDTTNPRVRVVTHKEIFKNPDDLPTFNSNAIEGNFHNLPDEVGPCFVYFNDDMFFANMASPEDFVSERGQILWESSWTAPPPREKLNNIWHRSIKTSNEALDALWGPAVRHYTSHGPYFFKLDALRSMYEAMPTLFDGASSHPFRHESDCAVPFLHHQWVYHYYHSWVAPRTINMYMKLTDDSRRAKIDFDRIESARPKTVCMNDSLDNDDPDGESIRYMNEFFQKLFPEPSQFEKK